MQPELRCLFELNATSFTVQGVPFYVQITFSDIALAHSKPKRSHPLPHFVLLFIPSLTLDEMRKSMALEGCVMLLALSFPASALQRVRCVVICRQNGMSPETENVQRGALHNVASEVIFC